MKRYKLSPVEELTRLLETSGRSRFKVAHRRHSGRYLPHAHTSYAALFFLCLVSGLLLLGVTLHTMAQSTLTVTATVSGEAPTQPATITIPSSGTQFSSIPITVSGDCQPNTIVKVTRNNVFAGSTLCGLSGTYSLQIDLFVGENLLLARSFNFADQPGPASPGVTVYYNPPTPAPSVPHTPTAPVTDPLPVTRQLFVTSDRSFQGAYVDESLTWEAAIRGGRGPYAISWDWGDGNRELLSLDRPGSFSVAHTYERSGIYGIRVEASDAAGNKAQIELIAIVDDRADPAIAAPIERTPFWLFPGNLLAAWPFYLLVLLLVVSFWLGERYELWYIRRHLERRLT